jgi:hypothetical protein
MMINVIVSWPRNCDYPLWRQFIRDNRTRFNEIIIAFTETNQGENYRQFVRDAMADDNVLFLEAPQPNPERGEDWRNLAVNKMLEHSYIADWVWFTEQDFYPKEGFWEEVGRLEKEGCEVIAVYQSERMHPCCIFINRNALNKTRKNFGIIKDKADHFSMIQKDLENAGVKIGKIDPKTYIHYNGLSQNMVLLGLSEAPNYQPEAFKDWLQGCLSVNVPLDNRFIELTRGKYAGIEPNTTPPHSPALPY